MHASHVHVMHRHTASLCEAQMLPPALDCVKSATVCLQVTRSACYVHVEWPHSVFQQQTLSAARSAGVIILRCVAHSGGHARQPIQWQRQR